MENKAWFVAIVGIVVITWVAMVIYVWSNGRQSADAREPGKKPHT